ncbi:MAG TPA: Hsp20/alpha crystallin family protein [Gaiella sp.]|nr:Hsp20/alpha crystallin family protein [Gaiella sp.]
MITKEVAAGMTVVTFRDPLFSSPFRLLDDVFRGFGGWSGSRVTGFTPLLDVRENDEEYLVMVDLPGVKSEDVSIEVNDGVVSISGSRTPVEPGDAQLKRREGAIDVALEKRRDRSAGRSLRELLYRAHRGPRGA